METQTGKSMCGNDYSINCRCTCDINCKCDIERKGKKLLNTETLADLKINSNSLLFSKYPDLLPVKLLSYRGENTE